MFPQNQWHKRLWGAFPARFSSLLVILKLILYYPNSKLCLNKSTVSSLPIQTDATLCWPTNNSIHCWMLHVSSVCTPCSVLHIVGSCCIRLHTTANTEAKTPNIVDPTMLGVVASVCTCYAVTAIMHVIKIVSSTKCQRSSRFCCLENN